MVAQRSFDELGTPLHDVTFCVIDLETTGGSPTACGITEIGAVKLRAGECLGTFQTLVNPGAAVPPEITVLTGITTSMVMTAPRIEQVLPTLLDFVGDSVIVAHNVRFDVGFLNAALERSGRPMLSNQRVDTVALARRLLRDEVPNCKLGTLAERLRLPHRPSHRALDDALATGDLLHVLLERVGRLGVTGLDDLLALPKLAGHPQVGKLALTDGLPRAGGVYLFRDAQGRVLYVGKAANLRQRVRSYFSGDERRKIPQLLRETHRIDHRECSTPIEASVLEIRLIHEHRPRFNAQIKRWEKYTYLKLTAERFPRLSITKKVTADGATYLGPLPSAAVARRIAEAIETAIPIRRCTARPGRTPRSAPCTAAQLGVATCPCAAMISEDDYRHLVERVILGLRHRPELILDPLDAKMRELAAADRYEEAADVRDRAAALANALDRGRRVEALRSVGHLVVRTPKGTVVEVVDGLFVGSWAHGATRALVDVGLEGPPMLTPPGPRAVPSRDQIDEMVAVARWVADNATQLDVLDGDVTALVGVEPLPRFRAARAPLVASGRSR